MTTPAPANTHSPLLCAYSGIFGEPAKGVHRWRIAGLAAVDLIGTGLIALLVSRPAARRYGSFVAFAVAFIILMALAFCARAAFCVRTRLNSLILGLPWGSGAGAGGLGPDPGTEKGTPPGGLT